jgi:hypothetical protein
MKTGVPLIDGLDEKAEGDMTMMTTVITVAGWNLHYLDRCGPYLGAGPRSKDGTMTSRVYRRARLSPLALWHTSQRPRTPDCRPHEEP